MQNLWILTEERPKNSVIKTILEEYCQEYGATPTFSADLKIKPIVVGGNFSFDYAVENATVSGIDKITIKIVSGSSSFVDYLIVRSENVPVNKSCDGILMAFEETKTSDSDSRNTAISQRASKFVFIKNYCPEAKKYMLYNDSMTNSNKAPTATNIFGTGMLLTLGVKFLGKSLCPHFTKFTTVRELIDAKEKMRPPNHTNTPIKIKEVNKDLITISGKLDKKGAEKKISHDPNIGGLSCIGETLRQLGWAGEIRVIKHNIPQSYINKTKGKNKCLYLFSEIGMTMEGITMPTKTSLPEAYWQYAHLSEKEKIASILLHLTAQYCGINGIYENHAGCERSFYRHSSGLLTALPKKDTNGTNLLLPDLILKDDTKKEIFIIEGKALKELSKGLVQIAKLNSIESEYINIDYPNYTVSRWLTIFGGEKTEVPDDKVLLYVSESGNVILNPNAPAAIKAAFESVGLA